MHDILSRPVGRFTVRLFLDDSYRDLGDVLGDEPILIWTRDRYGRTSVLHDGTRDVSPSVLDVLRLVDDSYSCTDVLDEMDADWTWTDGGRLRVDSDYLPRVRYYVDAETAVRSVFRAIYGEDLRDLKTHQFRTQAGWVYATWNQREMDRYAGTRDACAPVETVQAYLDGDVYGWTVEDADGDVLESCWGYIGDADYCIADGESCARYLETDACAKNADVLQASRPDLYAVPA